jgi:hypothetical protein
MAWCTQYRLARETPNSVLWYDLRQTPLASILVNCHLDLLPKQVNDFDWALVLGIQNN